MFKPYGESVFISVPNEKIERKLPTYRFQIQIEKERRSDGEEEYPNITEHYSVALYLCCNEENLGRRIYRSKETEDEKKALKLKRQIEEMINKRQYSLSIKSEENIIPIGNVEFLVSSLEFSLLK